MNKQESRKVGEHVATKWDEETKPVHGIVIESYRGHRQHMYRVRMSDTGDIEVVYHDQIV